MANEIKLPNTQQGGTVTSEGWIPHVRHPMLGINMPVKLALIPEGHHGFLADPVRRRDYLVYAMPQGGEYLHKA